MKQRTVNKKLKAFSFLEAIISVFVLSFGIVAVLPLMTSSLKDSIDSRDQIIAAFLAQEGVEVVENIRDNNWSQGNDAFDGHGLTGSDVSNTNVSYNTTSISGGVSKKMYINGSGYYVTSGSTSTRFSRRIDLDYSGSGLSRTLRVTSMVIWRDDIFPSVATCTTKNQCAYAETTLTQWH